MVVVYLSILLLGSTEAANQPGLASVAWCLDKFTDGRKPMMMMMNCWLSSTKINQIFLLNKKKLQWQKSQKNLQQIKIAPAGGRWAPLDPLASSVPQPPVRPCSSISI